MQRGQQRRADSVLPSSRVMALPFSNTSWQCFSFHCWIFIVVCLRGTACRLKQTSRVGRGGFLYSYTNHPDIANTVAGNACLDLRQKAIPQYSCQLLGSQTCSKHNNTISGSRQRPELTLVWEGTPTNTAWLECRRPPLSCGCYILQKNKTFNLGNFSTTSQVSTYFSL